MAATPSQVCTSGHLALFPPLFAWAAVRLSSLSHFQVYQHSGQGRGWLCISGTEIPLRRSPAPVPQGQGAHHSWGSCRRGEAEQRNLVPAPRLTCRQVAPTERSKAGRERWGLSATGQEWLSQGAGSTGWERSVPRKQGLLLHVVCDPPLPLVERLWGEMILFHSVPLAAPAPAAPASVRRV